MKFLDRYSSILSIFRTRVIDGLKQTVCDFLIMDGLIQTIYIFIDGLKKNRLEFSNSGWFYLNRQCF
jgi:hypothetical protein